MGNTDSIPVISQTKSLFQVMTGDLKGAKQTQINFKETGIIASQVTSLVHAINRDDESARNTQKKFAKGLEGVADSIPVVGHIKGGVHHALGQTEKGNAALKSASGSVLTIPASVGGAIFGGPAGGAAAAVAASHVYDGIVTGIDTAVNGPRDDGTPRYHGTWDTYDKISRGKASSGDIFDAAAGVGLEALGGATSVKVGKGVKGFVKSVAKETVESVPGISSIKKIKSKLRCRRDTGYYLSSEESDFVRTHLNVEDGMGKIVKANWTNMNVTDTVSNMVSLFVILKLILWNDKHGRNYGRELCSYTATTEEEIQICQLALLNNIRRLENRMHDIREKELFAFILQPDVPFRLNYSSTVLIKTLTSLYGILSSIGMHKKLGVIWSDEICLFKDPKEYKSCQKDLMRSLSTTHVKAFHFGQRRKRRQSCSVEYTTKQTETSINKKRKTTNTNEKNVHERIKTENTNGKNVGTYKEVRKNTGKNTGYEANHIPAASAFKDLKIKIDGMIAHKLPKYIHQQRMVKVGTSKSSKIAKTLRHFENELINAKKLDQAIKLDLISSYGRANALIDTSKGFRPALVEYSSELKAVVDAWSKTLDEAKSGRKPQFKPFIDENPNIHQKLQHLKKFIDDEAELYNKDYKNRPEEWIKHTESIYDDIVNENHLKPNSKLDPSMHLRPDEYKYGK